METSISTQLSQMALFDKVNTAVLRRGLDDQKAEGDNVLKLLNSAAPSFSDPALGALFNQKV